MTQVHFYDQTCVHVDGYRQIVSFDTTQVLLRCKKNMLVIERKCTSDCIVRWSGDHGSW